MLKLRCAWIWRVDNAVAWIQGSILVRHNVVMGRREDRSPSPSRSSSTPHRSIGALLFNR